MKSNRLQVFARRLRILPILSCAAALVLPLAAGCRTGPLAEFYSMNPFLRQGPEEQEYGPPPAERRREIIALARGAASLTPAERVRIGEDLAWQMQNEIDPIVRGEIVRALGKFDSDASREALRLALTDDNDAIRLAACEAWAKIGGAEAITILSERLASDTDIDVRLAATRALGRFNDEAALRGLAVALNDNSPAIQYRAMQSLGSATGQDLGYDVVAWRDYVNTYSPAAPQDRPTLVDRARGRFINTADRRADP